CIGTPVSGGEPVLAADGNAAQSAFGGIATWQNTKFRHFGCPPIRPLNLCILNPCGAVTPSDNFPSTADVSCTASWIINEAYFNGIRIGIPSIEWPSIRHGYC
ncbi:MAG TPA: hypothetical protein VNM90_21780, partial [Haliangium sp.]|nr:hypothetical protein [Haliangium sp.]